MDMFSEQYPLKLRDFLVNPKKGFSLRDYSTRYEGDTLSKESATELLERGKKKLSEIQEMLYAHNKYRVLIIFQAMDAAGKDGAVKHILSGLNPNGVKVYNFKAPTDQELEHDYFWRHVLAMPGRGEMAIHNRSHYENVLITKVHPEYILRERLPGIERLEQVNEAFWEMRYEQIRRFERNLSENGTIILKFFLHLSKNEQKKRFLERIEDPSKNWKFSLGDVQERQHWDAYQAAYEMALRKTSTKQAPWFVIPADDKWYSRLCIASIIHRYLKRLKVKFPRLPENQLKGLAEAKTWLNKEL
jgi:PPK2 family polyphosphate:nucleotide phosphotransferase